MPPSLFHKDMPSLENLPRTGAAALLLLFAAGILFPKWVWAPLTLLGGGLSILNTIFHEVGHMVFGMFGRALGVAGGTIGQFIFPTVVLFSAIRNKVPIAYAAAIFWIGLNFIDISPYIADARALESDFFQWWAAFGGPFMEKGDPEHHDWHIMLGSVGLLWADQILAWLSYLLGIGIMGYSVFLLLRKEELKP